MEDTIKNFIDGKDSDSGRGYGSGSGSDIGIGYGYGYGYGYGFGCGIDDGSGYGYGYGDGYSYGDSHSNRGSYGDGSGDRKGYGSGDGSGSGWGDRYGVGFGNEKDCDDVKAFNGQPVHIIDGLTIIITAIHNNIANGYILKEDFTLKPCYVAKVGGYFAHGYSARQALSDAQSKYQKRKPIEERIAEFNSTFPDRNKKIPAKELFKWHNILTGSCSFGRQEFCKDHQIDIDTDSFTVNEFIALTINEYGGGVIKQLQKCK